MNRTDGLIHTAAAFACILGLAACDKTKPVEADGQAPKTEAASPAAVKVATDKITPVYPDAAAVGELKLDYVSFQLVEGEGVTAVPLPPHVQAQTKLHLAPYAAGYDIVAGNESCVGPMALTVDGSEVVVLDAKTSGNSHHLGVDGAAHPEGVELSVAMAPPAQANFNCNIVVRPAAAQPGQ